MAGRAPPRILQIPNLHADAGYGLTMSLDVRAVVPLASRPAKRQPGRYLSSTRLSYHAVEQSALPSRC